MQEKKDYFRDQLLQNVPLQNQISVCKLTTLSPLFLGCSSFSHAIKMFAKGSHFCFLASLHLCSAMQFIWNW